MDVFSVARGLPEVFAAFNFVFVVQGIIEERSVTGFLISKLRSIETCPTPYTPCARTTPETARGTACGHVVGGA